VQKGCHGTAALRTTIATSNVGIVRNSLAPRHTPANTVTSGQRSLEWPVACALAGIDGRREQGRDIRHSNVYAGR
jgi:hypothetical protein